MAIKVIKLGGNPEDQDEADRHAGVLLSHKWLAEMGEDTHPLILLLALAHTMGHLLLACPTESAMKGALVHFMQEINFDSLLEAWKEKQARGDDDDEEDSIGTPVSSSIN